MDEEDRELQELQDLLDAKRQALGIILPEPEPYSEIASIGDAAERGIAELVRGIELQSSRV